MVPRTHSLCACTCSQAKARACHLAHLHCRFAVSQDSPTRPARDEIRIKRSSRRCANRTHTRDEEVSVGVVGVVLYFLQSLDAADAGVAVEIIDCIPEC
jgi:hypothetical protein